MTSSAICRYKMCFMPAFGCWLAHDNICAVCLAYCLRLAYLRLLQAIHVCQAKPCLSYSHDAHMTLHAHHQHYTVFAYSKLSADRCACMFSLVLASLDAMCITSMTWHCLTDLSAGTGLYLCIHPAVSEATVSVRLRVCLLS